jgi:cell division protein FtsB
MRRRKKTIQIGAIAAAAAIVLLAAILVVNGLQLSAKNQQYEEQIASLEEQVALQEERQQTIEAEEEYMQTQDYVEEIAQEKFGLVYPDEIIFRAVSGQ